MSITGNLKTMELAELLQWLSQAKKTGTLVVDSGAVQKQIHFRDGLIVSSASTDPSEYLGAFLVSHGYIDDAELREAVKMQESNKMLLGKVLVTLGAISEEDLHRMLQLKAEEGIYDVFTWREGAFRFFDGQLPATSMVPIDLDVAAIVLQGMQRVDEWRRIRAAIPSAGALPVAVGAWDAAVMTEGARQILSLVDDQRTIAEICRLSHAGEFHVCRILLRQVLAGRLKIVRPPTPEKTAEPAPAPAAPVPPTAEALVAAGRGFVAAGELDAGLRHIRAARALEPDNKKLEAEIAELENRIRAAVEKAGIRLAAVPELARRMEELTHVALSPQEGFLLTRIDGTSDLQSILRLTPLSPLDAQLVFWKLHRAGHVVIRERR